MVCYFAKNLGLDYYNVIDQSLRYLTSNSKKNIIFGGKSKFKLVGYSDFDWAGDYSDKQSILELVFTIYREPISYGPKKQVVVLLLSTKTEYMAFSLAVWEAT